MKIKSNMKYLIGEWKKDPPPLIVGVLILAVLGVGVYGIIGDSSLAKVCELATLIWVGILCVRLTYDLITEIYYAIHEFLFEDMSVAKVKCEKCGRINEIDLSHIPGGMGMVPECDCGNLCIARREDESTTGC